MAKRVVLKFSPKMEDELCELVRAHSHLYNPADRLYSNRVAVENAWQKIAREMGYRRGDIEALKAKWKLLRDRFVRSQKKWKGACKRGADQLSFDYPPVLNQLGWLSEFIKNRRPESHFKIQKTQKNPSVQDGPLSANNASAAQTNISSALQSALKYKSDSKEQQIKEEAIAKWIVRTGLPVTTIEDEDFVQMMETVDRRLTVPKKTKISNLISKKYEHNSPKESSNDRGDKDKTICPFYDETDWVSDDNAIPHPMIVMERATEEDMATVTPAPAVKTEDLGSVIKMEESPYNDNDIDSANPSSQPRGCETPHEEDTDESDPPAMPKLGDGGIGGVHNTRHKGRSDKRSNIQRVESQLSSLGELLLAECRREFEEMMSRDREWLEEDRQRRAEQLRTWQQEFQAIIETLTQSLHRKPSSSTPSGGLNLMQADCEIVSPKRQPTQDWSCEEETNLGPDVSYGVVIPASTPPRSASVPLADTPAPPPASHREVRRGAKRGWAPAPPPPPPGGLSVFQHVRDNDIGEEELFLLSLVPALKRLDNRKKSFVRLKFQQYLFDAEFSND